MATFRHPSRHRGDDGLGVAAHLAEVDPLFRGVQAAPFLGQVVSDAHGMLQLVELRQLLPAELRALLFQPADGTP